MRRKIREERGSVKKGERRQTHMCSFSRCTKLPLKIFSWNGPADPFTFMSNKNIPEQDKLQPKHNTLTLTYLYWQVYSLTKTGKQAHCLPGVKHLCWQGGHHHLQLLPTVHFQQHPQQFCCWLFLAYWSTVGKQFSPLSRFWRWGIIWYHRNSLI